MRVYIKCARARQGCVHEGLSVCIKGFSYFKVNIVMQTKFPLDKGVLENIPEI